MRILVLAATELKRDARIRRQLRWLSDISEVSCVVGGAIDLGGVDFIELGPSGTETQFVRRSRKALREAFFWNRLTPEAWYWSLPWVRLAASKLQSQCVDSSFDVIVANDLVTLPLALRFAGSRPVVFDAHEYYPEERPGDSVGQRIRNYYAKHLCTKFMPRAAAVVTVSEGVSSLYRGLVGASASVVPNFPDYKSLEPSVSRGSAVRLVHHGGYHPDRQLEKLVLAARLLGNRATLDFMLVGASEDSGIAGLRQMASGDRNVSFVESVCPENVCDAINEYDVGVYLLSPNCLNNRYALPNKFFDFIQARLATVIGPSSEMAGIVDQYGLGRVADDFTAETLALQIDALTVPQIALMKKNAGVAARQLCSRETQKRWLEVIRSVAY